ncbi:MAG: Clp1/GlmU family protein, partial [Anaerolineae bacterium]
MTSIQVPPEWKQLNLAQMAGTIVVIGQTDSGKSTFVRWLVSQLCRYHEHVGWLDADVGQSTLGVPTTMNLAVVSEPPTRLPPPDATFFVGATSPRGHMLPAVVGTHKLQERARQMGASAIVVDTTGMVAQEVGGGALKHWKIALLEPATIIAIQRHGELVHILIPLVRAPGLMVHIFPVAKAVNRKSIDERVKHRREQFRRYFADAAPLTINYSQLPAYDLEQAGRQRLLAVQDRQGFTIALGVITGMSTREMTIVTPTRDV